jgi:hypothetical protein
MNALDQLVFHWWRHALSVPAADAPETLRAFPFVNIFVASVLAVMRFGDTVQTEPPIQDPARAQIRLLQWRGFTARIRTIHGRHAACPYGQN